LFVWNHELDLLCVDAKELHEIFVVDSASGAEHWYCFVLAFVLGADESCDMLCYEGSYEFVVGE
jgi:hypothetical protein